jgi:hypothetical protein
MHPPLKFAPSLLQPSSISWTSRTLQCLPKLYYDYGRLRLTFLSIVKFSGNDFRRFWTAAKALTDASQQVYTFVYSVSSPL